MARIISEAYEKACEYYQEYVDLSYKENREFFEAHADKLIYCYENKKDMLDFDFWVQYEELLGEKITWDEYVAIDREFDGDPHDVDENDIEIISEFRDSLKEHRDIIVITQEDMDEFAARGEARLKQEVETDIISLSAKIKLAETQEVDSCPSSDLKNKNQENER